MDIEALAAANPGIVDSSREMIVGEIQQGGVSLDPANTPAPAPRAEPAAPAPAPAVKEVVQLGQPQAPEQLTPAVPVAPVPAPEPVQTIPLTLYQEREQQLARAQQEIALARQAIADRDAAWQAAQADLQFARTVRPEMPKWQGIEVQKREAEQKAAYLEARESIKDAAYEHALDNSLSKEQAKQFAAERVTAWETQFKQQQLLQQIAAQQERQAFLVQEQFNQRDLAFQKQQEEAQAQAWAKQFNDDFIAQYEKSMEAVPALKADPNLKQVIYNAHVSNARQGLQVPVAQVAAPYIQSLRAQIVAEQAAQPTRHEVHASMVRTTQSGSGVPAAAAAAPGYVKGSGIAGAVAAFRQKQLATFGR